MTQPGGTDIDYVGPFNEAFAQFEEGIGRAVDAFNQLVGQVKRYWWAFGPIPMVWIKRSLDVLRRAVQQIVDRVNYALEHQAPVLSLINASFAWVREVKTPASEVAGRITVPDAVNFDQWTGSAASAYRSVAALHKGAADDVVAKAEFMSQWLFRIARANVDYAVSLAKIVTDLVGKLTTVVVEAGSVVEIPWALDTAADAVGTLVEEGLNTLLTIGERFVDAVGNVRDVVGQMGDHTRLPGGAWPDAVRG